MTELELRNHVVKTATAWLGRKESNGTHKVIIDVYNAHKPLARSYAVTYTDPWCATYVSAVAIQCGLTDIIPTECSCYYMIELHKKLGTWKEADNYKPQSGDIVMYDWQDSGKGDNTGTPDHVGIVCSVSGSTMQIIEGNIDNSVAYRTLMVDGRYIRGYCLPNYASKADGYKAPAATEKVETSTDFITYTVKSQDTLWELAMEYLGSGTLYPQIMAANNLTTTWLYTGMKLKIPVAGSKAETKEEITVETNTMPVLRSGDEGVAVKILQRMLILRGYTLPTHGADGDFGTETETAIRKLQKAKNLTVDGVAGAKTWAALAG